MDSNSFNALQHRIIELIIIYGSRLLFAIVILFLGWWIINRVVKSIHKVLKKREVDVSLHNFISSLAKFGLRTLLIIAVAGMIGIEMTSFIAMLGAAGLAIGMALQGSLSNFAGGIIILVLKPFKVGEYIEANGISGTVREIQIFHTHLTSLNRQEHIIPNGVLANSSITNYSRHKVRGLSLNIRVGYENDIQKVKNILNEILIHEKALVDTPKHLIKVSELNDRYVSFSIQAWFETKLFWPTSDSLPEKIKIAFDKEGITMPFNQTLAVKLIEQ